MSAPPKIIPAPPDLTPRRAVDVRGDTTLFRAFWRWHFYAGFVVVPILLMLAVTGATYLLRFQIEPVLHADVMTVEPRGGQSLRQPYEAQRLAVEGAFPDRTLISMTEPRSEGHSTVFSTETPEGSPRDVFVDPWSGQVLGELNPDTTLSGAAVLLHAELMAGRWGDYLIELGASWAIVMTITGYYLFLRGRAARLRTRSVRARGAVLRNRHAVIGAVAGTGLLFLVVSGLPWTALWGERAEAIANGRGSSFWGEDPGALSDPTSTLDESLPHRHGAIPWGQQDSPVPTSDPATAGAGTGGTGGTGAGPVATVDTAVAVADAQGLRHPMTVALPADAEGVFSVLGFAFDAPTEERTVHVDQYGGQVASTYGYADYPGLAKLVSHGIALHEGRHYGTLNLLASLAFCLGIIFLCITGPLMWWKRRPRGAGAIGAPRGTMPLRSTPLLALGFVALGVFLPLFGLSLLVILVLDQCVIRRLPRLQHWFATGSTQ